MRFSSLVGLLLALISCSCSHKTADSKVQNHKVSNEQQDWSRGMHIRNGPILGLSYTDSLGTEYSHAHKRFSITNDTTLSINLQISVSKDYHFPPPFSDHKFKVLLWPQELGSAEVTSISTTISSELRHFLECETGTSEVLDISIQPNEYYNFTIGTLHHNTTNYYVSPNVLLLPNDGDIFSYCKNLINQDKSINASAALGLRLDIPNEGCIIIPCGEISYTE